MWWPDLAKDVAAWVSKCLACIKGRSRPTKVEARAVKCGAETCWQEVSVDCEGPNREDREGHRYSLTFFDCLSHAVLLEPMRSLTHAEVRRAFVRCVLRSRTMPSLVRSDRGAEFKNALMAELSVMLGAEWRFSAPLRPCELGANERSPGSSEGPGRCCAPGRFYSWRHMERLARGRGVCHRQYSWPSWLYA